MKSFIIKTLGCKVNQCDSQDIRDFLFKLGLRESKNIESADLCIVNTCCVTHSADRKSRVCIREVSRKKNSRSFVAVTGCYVNYDKLALKKNNGIDFIFQINEKEAFEQWVKTNFPPIPAHKNLDASVSFTHRTRAFLKIQEGCDNRCSYCVVPFMRGASRSKPIDAIKDEAKSLIDSGYKEIVLTGTNLGSFGKDYNKRLDLVDCIDILEKLNGLFRLRLSSIEAGDVTDKLLNKMSFSKKLCPHLHIPFQSGDDSVLRAMNRKFSVFDYKRIVEHSYDKVRDLAITCDVIVGFPGEEDKHFGHTFNFLKYVKPLRSHIFSFSERMGVSVYGVKNPCDVACIRRRYKALKDLADSLAFDFKTRFLGKRCDVLFEDKSDGVWTGYSPNYIKVSLASATSLKNVIKNVQLTQIEGDRVLSCENPN